MELGVYCMCHAQWQWFYFFSLYACSVVDVFCFLFVTLTLHSMWTRPSCCSLPAPDTSYSSAHLQLICSSSTYKDQSDFPLPAGLLAYVLFLFRVPRNTHHLNLLPVQPSLGPSTSAAYPAFSSTSTIWLYLHRTHHHYCQPQPASDPEMRK